MPVRLPSISPLLLGLWLGLVTLACTPTGQSAGDAHEDAKGDAKTAKADATPDDEDEPTTAVAPDPEPPTPDADDGDGGTPLEDTEPPPPLDTSCDDESDCTNSHANVFDDGTCCFGCGGDPANVVSVSKLSRWCSDHARNDCPKKKCEAPPAPKCVDGKCVSRY